MSVNTRMANREVCNLVFVEYTTKKPFLNVDYANVSTTEMTGESVYAYGGWGHPKVVTFYGDKGGTISFETQITPFKLYSLLTGAELGTTANWVTRKEITASTAGSLTLGTGITAATVFSAADDCGTEIAGTISDGTFTATAASDIAVGTKYVAYYTESLTGVKSLSIKSTTFPKYFTAYMETKDKTDAGEDVLFRMVAYKCAPQTEFSLEMSNNGDPGSLTVTCDLMEDTENDKKMLDMILVEGEG